MKVIIKKTTEKDIEKFHKKAWKEADLKYFGRQSDKAKQIFLKATEEGKIIGCLKARVQFGILFIKNIIVDNNLRERG